MFILFQIGYNPIQGEGGLAILVATENNEYECMKHLDFGVSRPEIIVVIVMVLSAVSGFDGNETFNN